MTSSAYQLSGASRAAAARPGAARPGAARPGAAPRVPLSVIPGGTTVRQAWFPIAMLLMLVAGLLGTLMLNTSLAEGSYTRGRLAAESTVLADRQESLTHELDGLRAPAALAKRAQSQGMVPAESAAFIRLSDGTILGVAKAATKDKPFSVITAPTMTKPKATKGKSKATTDAAPADATPTDATKD